MLIQLVEKEMASNQPLSEVIRLMLIQLVEKEMAE